MCVTYNYHLLTNCGIILVIHLNKDGKSSGESRVKAADQREHVQSYTQPAELGSRVRRVGGCAESRPPARILAPPPCVCDKSRMRLLASARRKPCRGYQATVIATATG